MTLVATLSPYSCPIMLGDILLSGARAPGAEVTLPTIGNVRLVDESVADLNHVAWLAPKICRITPNLAVGWSGDYAAAKRIIANMRAYSWPNQFSLECIQEFLTTTDYDDQASIGMAGIFATEKTFGEFGLNTPSVDLPLFNKSRVLGNGRERFIDMCRDVSDITVQGDASDWVLSVTTTLGFTTALIGEEINNYGGLKTGFGGFFEIMLFNGNEFCKLDDVLYCFWSVPSHNEDGIEISPYTTFIKVKYENDILIIRRVEFDNRRIGHEDIMLIPPMAQIKTMNDLDMIQKPLLTSTHNCHYVAVRNDDEYDILPVVQMFARDSRVRFDEEDHRLSFYCHNDLLSYISDRVIGRFYRSRSDP